MNYWPLLFLIISIAYFIFDLSSPPVLIWGAMYPLGILFGVGVYILTRKRSPQIFERYKTSRNLLIAVNLIFLILLLLANINLKSSLYERSYTFFIIIALAFGFVAVEIILINKEDKKLIFLNLLKTYILGLNLRLSARLLSSVSIKSDIWFHEEKIIVPLINSGFLPDLVYKNWPFMHIYLAISRIVSEVSIYYSHFVFIGLITSLGVLFVFLLTRRYVGTKNALLASLVYASLNYTIMETQTPIPSNLGVFILIFTLYTLFRARDDIRYLILSVLGLVSLIILHALVPLVLAILLAVSILIDKSLGVAESFINERKKEIFGFSIIGFFFIVLLITYWFYATKGWYEGIFYTVKRALSTSKQIYIYTWKELPRTILSRLGYLNEVVSLFFGTITICFWGDPSEKSSRFKKFAMVSFLVTSLIFLLTTVGSETVMPEVINQSKLILPERWHPYLDIFAAILISAVLFKFFMNKPALLFTIIVVFSVFETVYIAPELVWFGREDKKDLAIYRDSEYYPIPILKEKVKEKTFSEIRMGLFFDIEPFQMANRTENFFDSPSIISSRVGEVGLGILREKEDPMTAYAGVNIPFDLDELDFKNIVFTNGEILMFS